MTMVRLSELAVGQQGIIEDVDAEDHFRQRLQALGFRIGKEVRPIRQALFGGPLQVRVGSVNIMLRRNDAALIYVWAEG
ncbi:MAG TPA: FeoA family protein [Candidatus Contendobacter sp.]|nr:FeoA family protein [Candidatus Contendobacter sp.]HRZ22833.1 FeoA family protein [Candidatus Contendobacter sp.]HRZ51908.1 FeoA family protein [Candidatus Contendobacter sp.]